MKIMSEYLNKEFDIAVNETEIDGRMMTLIPHSVLEDIIHNQMPEGYNVRYDKSIEWFNGEHCVAKCTITDAHGRRVQDFGESVPATLNTEVGRNIPATMAVIRSFDRAAIRYLGFPGKNVYSSEEFVNQSEEAGYDDAAAPASQPERDRVDDLTMEEIEDDISASMEAELERLEEETPKSDPAPEKEKPSAPGKKNAAKSSKAKSEKKAAEDVGSQIINFGKFLKMPQSVSEICDNPANADWVEWALRQKPSDPDKKRQIELIRTYTANK